MKKHSKIGLVFPTTRRTAPPELPPSKRLLSRLARIQPQRTPRNSNAEKCKCSIWSVKTSETHSTRCAFFTMLRDWRSLGCVWCHVRHTPSVVRCSNTTYMRTNLRLSYRTLNFLILRSPLSLLGLLRQALRRLLATHPSHSLPLVPEDVAGLR